MFPNSSLLLMVTQRVEHVTAFGGADDQTSSSRLATPKSQQNGPLHRWRASTRVRSWPACTRARVGASAKFTLSNAAEGWPAVYRSTDEPRLAPAPRDQEPSVLLNAQFDAAHFAVPGPLPSRVTE